MKQVFYVLLNENREDLPEIKLFSDQQKAYKAYFDCVAQYDKTIKDQKHEFASSELGFVTFYSTSLKAEYLTAMLILKPLSAE